MSTVGIRELKEQTSQILRRVREGRETIETTYHGKVVARLAPVEDPEIDNSAELAAVWVEMGRLAGEIGAR